MKLPAVTIINVIFAAGFLYAAASGIDRLQFAQRKLFDWQLDARFDQPITREQWKSVDVACAPLGPYMILQAAPGDDREYVRCGDFWPAVYDFAALPGDTSRVLLEYRTLRRFRDRQ